MGFSHKEPERDVLETFAVADLFVVGSVKGEDCDDGGPPQFQLLL